MRKAIVLSHANAAYGRPFIEYAELEYKSMSYLLNTNVIGVEEYKPDFVVFTGGMDLNPELYHEPVAGATGWSPTRDKWEVQWFNWCKKNNIPMVGICRGMQLFTALTGGRLLQHIHHSHPYEHDIYDVKKQKRVRVNSLHHQGCLPSINVIPLGFYVPEKPWEDCVVESAYFPEIKSLGVQFHPEMMTKDSEGYKYFQDLMTEYIINDIL